MRKIKEVLRLHALGLTQSQIARSCSIGQSTVSDYLKAAGQAGIQWLDAAEWEDAKLIAVLRAKRPPAPAAVRLPAPDFATTHLDLQKHKHLTLQLVWEEYHSANPGGYRYSRFCELYQSWRKKRDYVLRHEHRAGEKMFVDYAGDTVAIRSPSGQDRRQAQIFVAVLGASNYTFAEATWTQGLGDWIGSHLRAFDFFGGAPEIVVPDNLKSGVTKACRYEPGVNRTYEEMAAHYGVAVIPARPRKPRDKAKVEAGVLVVERWILMALRKRTLFSLDELNQAIADLLPRLNQRPFRKQEGSRLTLFETVDQPALRPLPCQRYGYGDWATARVNIDYHIEYGQHWYSVPHRLTHQQVEVRASASIVEIFHGGQRVASHRRSDAPRQSTTAPEHRPKAHARYLDWTPSRVLDWVAKTGPAAAEVAAKILESKRHPEQGYRSCLGIIRLTEIYTAERVEAAARRALTGQTCSYQSVKSILKNNLDGQPLAIAADPAPPIDHSNLRGADYFDDASKPKGNHADTTGD